jgi:signal recognition particle subunit SRP54
MIPGMGAMKDMLGNSDVEGDMDRLFGIIDSMTPEERRNPSRVIDQSRRRRIAAGAGVQPHEVNDLVKQFDGMASLMKGMAGMGMRDRMREMQRLQQGGMLNPGASLAKPKVGTGKRLTADEKRKLKKQREKEAKQRRHNERHKGNGRSGDSDRNGSGKDSGKSNPN